MEISANTCLPMELFIKEKPAKALVFIRRKQDTEDVFVSKVSRRIDTTYAHSCKTVEKLEEQGYIKTQKKGRKKLLKLTEEGERVAENLGELLGEGIFKETGMKETSRPLPV